MPKLEFISPKKSLNIIIVNWSIESHKFFPNMTVRKKTFCMDEKKDTIIPSDNADTNTVFLL